jgi:hypothetical protein
MSVRRILILGAALWAAATVLLRVAGQYLMPATPGPTIVVFVVSCAAMAALARRVCRRAGLSPGQWPTGALILAATTLALDPFTSAFFPTVFPNMRPELAGTFGGLMLSCVAGALFGATLGRPRTE